MLDLLSYVRRREHLLVIMRRQTDAWLRQDARDLARRKRAAKARGEGPGDVEQTKLF